MIGLDTNVLVRYIVQDDPKQSPKAVRLVESLTADAPGYVGIVVLVELVWVLSSCYAATKEEICVVLEGLQRTTGIVIADADVVWKALRMYRDRNASDFADCLVQCSALDDDCECTMTFDRNAAKNCGMKLID
jgi:predicted nucleic-acid-binding protein